jgi:P-type Cu2+ transporter
MNCEHCGAKNKDKYSTFCCMGCEIAYKIINKLDLNKYYEYCKIIYNKMPMKVHAVENQLNYNPHIKSEDSKHRINLIVEGIHCGSCVWLIENTLKKQDGVLNARLNMSTRRLVIEWNGEKKQIKKLIDIIEKLGYKLIPYDELVSEEERKTKEHFLLKCIAVSGFASMSIMMISLGVWAGNLDESLGPYVRELMHWLSTIIAIPAILYSGIPFYKSAWSAIKAKRSNMDVPITIAIIVSALISLQQIYLGGAYTYYDAAVSLVFFLLIGRYLDIRARNKASERAQNIILSQVRSVTLCDGDKLKLVSLKKAKEGYIAFVAVGEKIPVDGVVVDGDSEVDNSLITGETIPSKITIGSNVNAGTINLINPLKIRITKLGDNTVLAEMIKLMEVAEQGKAKYVKIADRVSSYYTPIVLTLSAITFLLWMYLGANFNDALLYAVSVLIITCPCALGLAVPVVQVIASSKLMSKGVLIKSADALEKLAEIDLVVFDKTGTLTLGKPQWINKKDFTPQEIKIISSIASHSKHPLSQAVYNNSLKMLEMHVEEVRGMGLEAVSGTRKYKLGNRKFCEVEHEILDDKIEMWFRSSKNSAKRIILEDKLKDDALELVTWFKNLKMQPIMLSGDRRYVVSQMAAKVGITSYKAEVRPVDKYHYLEDLAKQEHKVLMVGDGLNDSAALKAAHVSISPASAIDIAQTNSDIVIQGDKLWPVKESYLVAKFANKLVKQNFALSLFYNLVTIPIAMGGLATPILAAVVMSLSSIMVVANSMRLNGRG